MNSTPINLVLASQSPRRKEILGLVFGNFTVFPSGWGEKIDESKPIFEIATCLADGKASSVFETLHKDESDLVVIGADTIVCVGDEILGKPKDAVDAARMLKLLSGKSHEVLTGYSVISESAHVCSCEITRVDFRDLSDDEIDTYISTGEPFDKAGAYGIQGKASVFVRKIDGDFYNVMGFPLFSICETLKHDFSVLPDMLL